MTSIPSDLARMILEKLMNGAIAESRHICCFRSIVEDFETEKEKLKAKRTTVREYVKVANRRAEGIRSDVTLWEEQADKLIQEDTKTKMTCFFGWCLNCKWQYIRGKELANKKEDIKRLMESGNFECVGIAPDLPGVEYHSSRDYISFKSRESKHTELLEALTGDNNYITGLLGMGGTGKTTLAKEVGKALKKSKQFDQVIDTTVSYTPDIRKIQDDIAGPLGLSMKKYSESERPRILWSRLTSGEKFLLILDDVWGHINFEEIGIPYSDNHKGCRVLLTTRNLWVCNIMGCEKIIQLELLSEEDAWILFKKHANVSNGSSKRLLDKGRLIAKECKGLPVAIAVIASSLKGEQRLEEWNATLKSLQKFVPIQGVDENLVEIYKCLRYSYDNMKNEKVKGLFLLCSMFPEDEELPIEILTRFGIGAGLFGEVEEKYDEARSQVVVAKNKLIDSCLLMKAEKGCVKMHDLVREVALWIANKDIQTVNLSNKGQKSLVEREKYIKYLLCEGKGMDVFSWRFGGSKLEILSVYMDEDFSTEVPNSFFENMQGLRVLHLSCKTLRKTALSLPQSIQSLTNIRSLFLQRFELGDISILANLRSLETLDLFDCSINELPCEIMELEKLRLLNLDWCEIKRNNPFEVIERCSSLEELYFTEATLKYLMQTAEFLRLFGIKEGWRNLIPDIVPIDKGMNDLIELILSSNSQLRCLVDTKHVNFHVKYVFSKLVVLELENMENLEELCSGPLPFDFLKSLERLQVDDCKSLQSILFKSKLNLCNLKTMKLHKCPTLVSLFQSSTSRSLVLLEELEIFDCKQLENIISCESTWEESSEEIDDGDNDNKSYGSMFPNLKILDITWCPQLEYVFPFLSAQDVPVVEVIKIHNCGELKYIFGQCQHEYEGQDLHQQVKDVILGSLKEMELSRLPNFIDIFPECHHLSCLSMKRSSSRDGSQGHIQADPIKCNFFPWTQMCRYAHKYKHKFRSTKMPWISKDQLQDCSVSSAPIPDSLHLWEHAQCLSKQSQILRNIKEIELCNLSKIKSVFILSISPTMLLETLRIEDCDDLKHIIMDLGDGRYGNTLGDVFPKLKALYVQSCRQLEYIFGQHTYNHQNYNVIHLHLAALKYLNLCDLPNLIGICPETHHTTMPSLSEFELEGCSQFIIKSIGDLIVHLDSRQRDSIIIKGLSENMKHFLTLESLKLYNAKVENIFCLNETIEQEVNLGLQHIQLRDLSQMTFIFMGPKNSFTLQNLTEIAIVGCEKVEVVFSSSVARCLPQLHNLVVEECKELKHIIEEDNDNENQKMSNLSATTFCPKLTVVVVKKCNNLKCVFPVWTSKSFPELELMIIKESSKLEEVFRCEGEKKVELPSLKIVLLIELPSLCRGIELHSVKGRLVQNCPKLSLTSTFSIASLWRRLFIASNDKEFEMDVISTCMLQSTMIELPEDYKSQDTSNEAAETTAYYPTGPEVQVTSARELTTSQEFLDEQLIEGDDSETKDESIQDDSTSEKIVTVTLPTESEARKTSPELLTAPLQQGIKRNMEEATTSPYDQTTILSTHSESASSSSSSDSLVSSEYKTYTHEGGEDQIAIHSFSVVAAEYLTAKHVDASHSQATSEFEVALTENSAPISLDNDASVKVSSIIEEYFDHDDDIVVSDYELSPSIPSLIAFQSPSVPFEGNPSQVLEDLSFGSLVTRELEQLVSNKHLAPENLSLLTDFLVKHPSVRLMDNALSNRSKGFAYNCLAELLKFLQAHNVLDVLGSSHSEFVELLHDVRRFAFDKNWLDGIERRASFPCLQLEVSQDALQTLLESKHILSQHVEDLKHQLASSEAVLESINQQEAQILEACATLRAPLGY